MEFLYDTYIWVNGITLGFLVNEQIQQLNGMFQVNDNLVHNY